MNRIINLINKNKSREFWLVVFAIVYIIGRGVFMDMPFLNLLIINFENGIIIFWILMLLFWRFTYQNLIIISALLLIAYSCSVIIRNGINNDNLGVMIYISLILAFIKYVKEYK